MWIREPLQIGLVSASQVREEKAIIPRTVFICLQCRKVMFVSQIVSAGNMGLQEYSVQWSHICWEDFDQIIGERYSLTTDNWKTAIENTLY